MAELELLRSFVTVLEEEYEALLGTDEERLTLAAGRKRSLIPALAALDPGLFAHDPAASRALAEAAEKNGRNGVLIRSRLADVERRKTFLDAARGVPAPLYGPDGNRR